MKSLIKLSLKSSFLALMGVLLFSFTLKAETRNNFETLGVKVNVSSFAGKRNFNLKVDHQATANEMYITVYDSDNNKIISEWVSSKKALRKKFNLKKFKSENFYFVIESGTKIYTQEVW